MDDFSGKVILVAGGTGGLGRAVSLAFLGKGARVVTPYFNALEFESLKVAAGSGNLTGESLDVTNEAAVGQAVNRLAAQHGRLDALVNAVGGYAGGAKLWEADAKDMDRMLSLNLRAGFVLSRAVVPMMLKQRHGAIVNIAAKAALDPPGGAAAYAASKAAALAMLESLAADLKGTGVRANTVLPSIIDTEANRQSMPDADYSKWPKPEDIAKVILFLCSDDAKVVHGAAIPVYGDS